MDFDHASVNSLDSTPATDTNGPSTSAAAAAARLRIAARDNKAKRQASPNSSATATKRSSFPVIAQKAQPKPPPIVLRDIISINELLLCIEEVCSLSNLQVKSSMGESLRIYADDSDTYRKIVRQLEEMKIEFHSYQLKEDKPFRVVVRRLHYSQIHTQIAAELKNLGHSVLTIHNPISKKTGERMNLFFINIEAKDNNKKILEVRALCHQLVRIETARKSQDLVQCRRCQEFGHTAKYCRRPFRCVSCGKDHKSSECTRSKDELATCIHCQGAHPANFRGCEFFIAYEKKTRPKGKKQT